MECQLNYVATVDLLANHGGMVSDSRKLVSYGTRFEVFQRSLANVVGKMVERVEYLLKAVFRKVEKGGLRPRRRLGTVSTCSIDEDVYLTVLSTTVSAAASNSTQSRTDADTVM